MFCPSAGYIFNLKRMIHNRAIRNHFPNRSSLLYTNRLNTPEGLVSLGREITRDVSATWHLLVPHSVIKCPAMRIS